VEAAYFRDSTAFTNCFSKPATNRDKIMQESEGIQNVGLPRGIGANEKGTRTQRDIHVPKVAPVLQSQVRKETSFHGC